MIGFVYVRDIPKIVIAVVIGIGIFVGLATIFEASTKDIPEWCFWVVFVFVLGVSYVGSHYIWEWIDDKLWNWRYQRRTHDGSMQMQRQSRMQQSTPRQINEKNVKQRWPDAMAVRTVGGVEINTDLGKCLGRGRTQDDAWRDAAERISRI